MLNSIHVLPKQQFVVVGVGHLSQWEFIPFHLNVNLTIFTVKLLSPIVRGIYLNDIEKSARR